MRKLRPEHYQFYRDAYGFNTLSRITGFELTKDRRPDARYHLPEGTINLYSRSPTLTDLTQPFRPSDEVIAEFFVDENNSSVERYLSGDMESFEELDRAIMASLKDEDLDGYFKEIL